MKSENYVKEKSLNKLILSSEEINSFEINKDMPPDEKEELKHFVYNIAFILYKLFENESP